MFEACMHIMILNNDMIGVGGKLYMVIIYIINSEINILLRRVHATFATTKSTLIQTSSVKGKHLFQ